MSSEFGQSPREDSDEEIARRLIEGADLEDICWDYPGDQSPYSQAFIEQFNRMSAIKIDDFAKSGVETSLFEERVFIDHKASTQFGEICDVTNQDAATMRIVVAGSLFLSDSALSDSEILRGAILAVTNPELGNKRTIRENRGHYFGYMPSAFLQGGHPIIRRVYSHDEVIERSRIGASEFYTGVPNYALYVGELEETVFIDAMPIFHNAPTMWARVYSRSEVNEVGFGIYPKI